MLQLRKLVQNRQQSSKNMGLFYPIRIYLCPPTLCSSEILGKTFKSHPAIYSTSFLGQKRLNGAPTLSHKRTKPFGIRNSCIFQQRHIVSSTNLYRIKLCIGLNSLNARYNTLLYGLFAMTIQLCVWHQRMEGIIRDTDSPSGRART